MSGILDIQDPISAIALDIGCTNGSTYNKGNFISDIVTKIEIVDGSEVLASANMKELQALQFFKTGKMPRMMLSEWGGGGTWESVMLLFGRRLWDQMYAFDPTVYRNPQLKVTFNKAAIAAASDTVAFATGDNIKISAVAKIMENPLSRPAKFLMPKQIVSWTSSTSGDRRLSSPSTMCTVCSCSARTFRCRTSTRLLRTSRSRGTPTST